MSVLSIRPISSSGQENSREALRIALSPVVAQPTPKNRTRTPILMMDECTLRTEGLSSRWLLFEETVMRHHARNHPSTRATLLPVLSSSGSYRCGVEHPVPSWPQEHGTAFSGEQDAQKAMPSGSAVHQRRLGASPNPDTIIPIPATMPTAASRAMVAPLTLFSAGLSTRLVAPAKFARDRLVF